MDDILLKLSDLNNATGTMHYIQLWSESIGYLCGEKQPIYFESIQDLREIMYKIILKTK